MNQAPLESELPGIYFRDRRFSEPSPFNSANTIPSQGIYAILVRDEGYTPRPFQIIYFGESDKLARRVNPLHESYEEWVRQARGAALYVAFYNTAGTPNRQRKELQKQLIEDYNPPCNERNAEPGYSILKPLLGS
jgi:hypothetical protein